MNYIRSILVVCLGTCMIQTVRLTLDDLASRSSPVDLSMTVDKNPRLSGAWMTMGIEAERTGDFQGAEGMLLQAARVDHQFLPAWTLANFYFRRDDEIRFWPWAKRAADLTFDDYRPLLRLCDQLDPRPSEVIARLEGGPALRRAYADLLVGQHRVAEAQEVSHLLPPKP